MRKEFKEPYINYTYSGFIIHKNGDKFLVKLPTEGKQIIYVAETAMEAKLYISAITDEDKRKIMKTEGRCLLKEKVK